MFDINIVKIIFKNYFLIKFFTKTFTLKRVAFQDYHEGFFYIFISLFLEKILDIKKHIFDISNKHNS